MTIVPIISVILAVVVLAADMMSLMPAYTVSIWRIAIGRSVKIVRIAVAIWRISIGRRTITVSHIHSAVAVVLVMVVMVARSRPGWSCQGRHRQSGGDEKAVSKLLHGTIPKHRPPSSSCAPRRLIAG